MSTPRFIIDSSVITTTEWSRLNRIKNFGHLDVLVIIINIKCPLALINAIKC